MSAAGRVAQFGVTGAGLQFFERAHGRKQTTADPATPNRRPRRISSCRNLSEASKVPGLKPTSLSAEDVQLAAEMGEEIVLVVKVAVAVIVVPLQLLLSLLLVVVLLLLL